MRILRKTSLALLTLVIIGFFGIAEASWVFGGKTYERGTSNKPLNFAQFEKLSVFKIAESAVHFYPSLKKVGASFMLAAISRSSSVAEDMRLAGIVEAPMQVNAWSEAAAKCLSGATIGKYLECVDASLLIDKVYGFGKGDLNDELGKMQVFAVMIVEEYLFMLKNQEKLSSILNLSGMSIGGGSATCMLVPLPSAKSSNSNVCSMSGMFGGAGDPSPISAQGSGSSQGGLSEKFDSGKFFGKDGPCPIDQSKLGGGAFDKNPTTTEEETPAAVPVPAPEPEPTPTPAPDPEPEPEPTATTVTTTTQPTKPAKIITSTPTTLPTKSPNVSLDKEGKVNVPVGEDLDVQFYVEDGKPMVGATYKWTPNPTEDSSFSSICGKGPLDSMLGGCFFGGEGNAGGSQGVKPDFGPDDKPSLAPTSGGAAMLGDAACAQLLKYGGVYDPLPIDDGLAPSVDNVGCGPSVGGKPSASCCKQDPNYPGCGGPNPVYQDKPFSKPAYQDGKSFYVIPRTKYR